MSAAPTRSRLSTPEPFIIQQPFPYLLQQEASANQSIPTTRIHHTHPTSQASATPPISASDTHKMTKYKCGHQTGAGNDSKPHNCEPCMKKTANDEIRDAKREYDPKIKVLEIWLEGFERSQDKDSSKSVQSRRNRCKADKMESHRSCGIEGNREG